MATQVSVSMSGDINFLQSFAAAGAGVARLNAAAMPANAVTEYLITFPTDEELQVIMIVSSVNCTLYFNGDPPGTGTASATLQLTAGVPVVWWQGLGITAATLFGNAQVTSVHANNQTVVAGTLTIAAQYAPSE